MKIFVLSIFVIFATIMAQLPSILGCRTHGRRRSLGERSVGSKGSGGDLLGFEMEGFSICNTDGTEGLSFDEIMECKARFGALVNYYWPTDDDFRAADSNGDENLTIEEFLLFKLTPN